MALACEIIFFLCRQFIFCLLANNKRPFSSPQKRCPKNSQLIRVTGKLHTKVCLNPICVLEFLFKSCSTKWTLNERGLSSFICWQIMPFFLWPSWRSSDIEILWPSNAGKDTLQGDNGSLSKDSSLCFARSTDTLSLLSPGFAGKQSITRIFFYNFFSSPPPVLLLLVVPKFYL